MVCMPLFMEEFCSLKISECFDFSKTKIIIIGEKSNCSFYATIHTFEKREEEREKKRDEIKQTQTVCSSKCYKL